MATYISYYGQLFRLYLMPILFEMALISLKLGVKQENKTLSIVNVFFSIITLILIFSYAILRIIILDESIGIKITGFHRLYVGGVDLIQVFLRLILVILITIPNMDE